MLCVQFVTEGGDKSMCEDQKCGCGQPEEPKEEPKEEPEKSTPEQGEESAPDSPCSPCEEK